MKKFIISIIILLLVGVGVYLYFNNDNDIKNVTNKIKDTKKEIEFKDVSNSIFKDNYDKAYNKMKKMSIEEKVGQLFLVRYDSSMTSEYSKYFPSGYVLFSRDFNGQTKESIKEELDNIDSNIPLTFAVDEEGGFVTRVSRYINFRNDKFLSPRSYYDQGGYDLVKKMEKEKAELLLSIGINLNLAPVADVSTNPNDFIYNRSFGLNAEETSTFIKNMVEYSNEFGISSCLKHFPGYGNNVDTHTGSATDNRSYETFTSSDYLPFIAGIKEKVPMILVSHNIVTSIDDEVPASLSIKIHEELRDKLKFSGIIITDDLDMSAIKDNYQDGAVMAVNSNNDLIITSDFINDYNKVLSAYKNKLIDEQTIDRAVTRIIAWKYSYKIM